jgi:pimeloyl-ACP methyl ester carboxylesterase
LKWQFAEDIMQYDLLKNIDKLTMPVLLIVGSEDPTSTYAHQEILYKKIPGKKELHKIEGAGHVFRGEFHLDEISSIMSKWISGIND